MIPYNIESSSSTFDNYYQKQAGGYLPIFRGKTIQRGSGIGGVFSRMFRGILPMIKEGAKTAGKQLLSSGVKIATDLIDGKNLAESAKKNLTEGGKQLIGNLTQAFNNPKKRGGVKKRKLSALTQNRAKSKRRKLTKDIFN